jgi:hypothetical protein
VKIKMKVRTGFTKTLSWGICAAFVLLAACAVQADTVLWSNYGGTQTNINNVFGSDNRCDASCGNPGVTYTVFDNFTVPNVGWVATHFDYFDFFAGTATSEYQSTTWSLWQGDPLNGGKLWASGTGFLGSLNTIGTPCSANNPVCLEQITVTLPGTGVLLAGGQQYYLGISNSLLHSGDVTDRAVVVSSFNGPLPGWEQSNGSISGTGWAKGGQDYTFPSAVPAVNATDTAFDIIGSPAPEPGTVTLMAFALAGLGYMIRRRRRA